jgi:GT2 family glycosyltransferase
VHAARVDIPLKQNAGLPSVTVVVLSYNSRRHLGLCFRSLVALHYPAERLELMLVDNASDDDSSEFVASHFPQVTIVCNPDNYGFARGNNEGARRARGQLVAFLNPDMRVAPDWLAELVAPIQRELDVVCTASKILNWNGRWIDFAGSGMNFLGFGYQEGWGESPTAHTQEKPVLAPCGGAMLVDRKVFLDSGGFDEGYFAFYEDLDLGWRLWTMGYKVVYAPRAVAYHVHHGSWGQVANAKTAVLYQRNAFSNVVKNYDDESLKRVLPVVLLLYLRRAYLATGVDPSPLRSEPLAVAPHLHVETPHIGAPLPPYASAVVQPYDSSYYLRETWRTLRCEGLAQLWRKVVAEVRRRWQNRSRRQCSLSCRTQRWTRPGHVFVARQAISHLIAADDLVQGLDRLMQKRQVIQRRRCRSDQEIASLFRWPFASDNPNPHYMQTMGDLVTACGLHDSLESEKERDEASADRQR